MAFLGCETVIDVPGPSHDPRLVPQGFFTRDSLWTVWVTHSVPYASSLKPDYVSDATLSLWEDDRFVLHFQPADSGRYEAAGPLPDRGAAYSLRVEASDYVTVEGLDSLPPFPVVSHLETRFVDPGADAPADRRRLDVSLTLEDPGERNRYGLLLLQARLREDRRTRVFTPLPAGIFPFESEDAPLLSDELAFLSTGPSTFLAAFFTDETFAGGSFTFSLSFVYDAPSTADEVATHRGFAVVVMSVSDAFYRYWTTARQQALSNENPFSEPLRVGSNVSGGLGVFAGFQFDILPVAVDTLGYHHACGPAAPYPTLCDALLHARLPIIARGLF
jgi:Domain of unknown function (DUF4249)